MDPHLLASITWIALPFDERDRKQVEQRLVHRLERLGYVVNLQPLAA
jgi:hypothetical protein